jgi:hypothetical protein
MITKHVKMQQPLGMVVVVVGSTVVALTMFVEWHVLKISWLDAIGCILFFLALLMQAFLLLILNITSQGYGPSYLFSFLVILIFVCAMIFSLGDMVVSIVVIMNWHINKV